MSRKKQKKNPAKEYSCIPNCPYFPHGDTTGEWYYDEKEYCKKHLFPTTRICAYDGHIITNWYECPLKKEKENESSKSDS